MVPCRALSRRGLHFLFALEANQLRRWSLYRRGWRLAAVVGGDRIEDAEARYLVEAVAALQPSSQSVAIERAPGPASASGGNGGTAGTAGPNGDDQIVGLFPAPEGGAR